MTDKRWKQVERNIAAAFGTTRTPLSGGNSMHGTSSDTLHKTLYIEVKHGGGCPKSIEKVLELYSDVTRKARLEKKIPILVLHYKHSSNYKVAYRHAKYGSPNIEEVELDELPEIAFIAR